jgi:hypothetical protein
MNTEQCRAYLVEHCAKRVERRYEGRIDGSVQGKLYALICADARKPSKWKRRSKYHLGSLTDVDGGNNGGGANYSEQFGTDGVVREFYLEGSDGVCFALIEVNNKIVDVIDLSD